jgi:hypothetical protein
MSSQYLSKSGLTKLWSNISSQFVKKEDGKGLFSGAYADLTGAPTNVSSFTNDAGYAVASEVADTYLTKDDASTTYVTLENYNEKVAALEQADTDNLAAAKKYADDTFVTSVDYEAKVKELEEAGTDNLDEAKKYADDNFVKSSDYATDKAALEKADTDNLAAAKTYADDNFVKSSDYATDKAALEKADTDNLTAAKGYADTVSSTALSDAKSYVDDAVGAITGFDFQIVDALPAEGTKGVIYLVAAAEGDNVVADDNSYNEYIYITDSTGQSSFELIGTTKMDLTGYLKEVDIVAITDDEIDEICK